MCFRHCLTAVLVFGLLIAMPAASAGERQLKEAELAKLRARISDLKADLESTRGRYTEARRDLAVTERRMGRIASTMKTLDRRIADQRKRLEQLAQEQRIAEQSIAGQRDALGRQVRAAYAMGRQDYLKLILNQQDPAAVGRLVAYYDYFNRSRVEKIDALEQAVSQLEAVRGEIRSETARLEGLHGERAAEKSKLEDVRSERSGLIAKLKEEISTKDQRLARFRANEKELQRVLDALADALRDIPADLGNRPFAKLRGKLPWPAPGQLAARFGAERVDNVRWQGVLIRAAEGQPVRAVYNGRVVFAEWLRGYGLLVIINHGDGFMSLYGRNRNLTKEVGDWVQAGDVIATVGDSGGSEQTALYFEIRHKGRPLDPSAWLRHPG